MDSTDPETAAAIKAFIGKWEVSGGHEHGAGQHFLIEFCELLGMDRPTPPLADNERNAYTFERRVERKRRTAPPRRAGRPLRLPPAPRLSRGTLIEN